MCGVGSKHFSVLRICRSAGASARRYGHDRDFATHVVFAGVHRCADLVEWRQRALDVTPLESASSLDARGSGRVLYIEGVAAIGGPRKNVP